MAPSLKDLDFSVQCSLYCLLSTLRQAYGEARDPEERGILPLGLLQGMYQRVSLNSRAPVSTWAWF